MVALAASTAAATAHEVDLSQRAWCELRPYGLLQRLPLQRYRIHFTGLIRGTDPDPDWRTLAIRRDGGRLSRQARLDDIDGPDQFAVDARFLKIYVSGYDAGAGYEAVYQPSKEAPGPPGRAALPPIRRRGSVGRRQVPLMVEEPVGADRRQWPVCFGVPLPIGELVSADQVRLLDPQDREIPGQFQPTGYWADGTVKWLTVDFQADVGPGRRVAYVLEYGNDVRPRPFPTSLVVEDRDDAVLVNTAALQLTISKRRFNLFDHVALDMDGDGQCSDAETIVPPRPGGGATLLEPARSDYVNSRTCVLDDKWSDSLKHVPERATTYRTGEHPPDSVVIETVGPMRAVIRVRGGHAAEDGRGLLKYDVRYHAYAGHRMVRLSYTFTNAQDDQVHGRIRSNLQGGGTYASREAHWRIVRRLALTLPIDLAGRPRCTFGVDGTGRHVVEAGDMAAEIHQSDHGRCTVYEHDTPVAEGTHMAGWMDVSDDRWGLTVGVRHGWQQWPKSLLFQDGMAVVELWPDRQRPHFDCYRGLSKRHEMLFYFHPGSGHDAESVRIATCFEHPLIAPAPPAWFQQTMALGELGAHDPDLFRTYETSVEQALASYVARRRERLPQRHYGMRDYGDSFCGAYRASMAAGGIPNWSNWDDPEGNSWINLEYDGTLTFLLEFARRGTRPWFHEAEIAGRHWMDIDHVHHPSSRLGAQYAHGPEHVGQKPGAAGHAWVDGLLAFAHLFADPRAHEIAMSHGAFKLRQALPANVAMYRGHAWPALAFVSLYADCWDQRYLEAARHYFDRFMQSPVSGPWPYYQTQTDLTEGPGWMMQVAGLPVMEYFRITGDPRGRTAIVQYAERVLDDFTPTQITRSTSYPWVVEVLSMAYELTGDDRFLKRALEIFNEKSYGSSNPKWMAITTKRMPAAMGMLARWLPRSPLVVPIRPQPTEGGSGVLVSMSIAQRPALGRHALRIVPVADDGGAPRPDGRPIVHVLELDEPDWLAPTVAIAADPAASGGECLRWGQSSLPEPPNRLSFRLHQGGEYRLAARIRLDQPSQRIDFRIDGGRWMAVTPNRPAAHWQWHILSPPVALSSDRHLLEFRSRTPEAEADLVALIPNGLACVVAIPGGVALDGEGLERILAELINPTRHPRTVRLRWDHLPAAVRVDRSEGRLNATAGGTDATAFAIEARKGAADVWLQCAPTRLAMAPGARRRITASLHNRSTTHVRGRISLNGLPPGLRTVPTSAGVSLAPDGQQEVKLTVMATGLATGGVTDAMLAGSFSEGPAWTRSTVQQPVAIAVAATAGTVALEAERSDVRAAGRSVVMDATASEGHYLSCASSRNARCAWGIRADKQASYVLWALLKWPDSYNLRDLGPDAPYGVQVRVDRDHATWNLVDPPDRPRRNSWHWLRAEQSIVLKPGAHYLELVNQVAYVDIDRLVVTRDPDWRAPPPESPPEADR